MFSIMNALPNHTGHLAAGGAIDVECRMCGACSKVPAAQEQALRCGRCGAGGDKVRPRFASRLFRDRDGRPLRIRDLYAARQELRLWCSHCRPAHEVRFATARQVEALVSAINPTIADACRHLVCPASQAHGMVAVAAAPTAMAQMPLPFGRP
jgi:hypothetical protein